MTVPALLGLAERAINRLLHADPDAGQRLAPLIGRRIRFDSYLLSDHQVTVAFDEGGLRLDHGVEAEADATVSGGPAGLLRSALNPGDRSVFGDGTLRVSGDATLVQAFSELLSHYRPDWQGRVQTIAGDAVAARMENAVEALDRWRRQALRKAVVDGGEYLREERRLAVDAETVSGFADRVDDLAADLARLEQRVARLETEEEP